ncbi:hypothetical protein [Micromonospora sp. ATA51]|uniref:hypothetical protein n=1 Tax=Micromonospora sp. ATA51 TaxID=2806098 RepID=UPI001EE3D7A5|nr:hypothetical protein [Micromonospora sp. ATA51]
MAITATDSACDVARTSFDPGTVTFTVNNKGSQTTEVYVYGQQGDAFTKVVAEVENIGPGLTRDLSVTFASGRYEIACKPGQTGNGIRTPITVSGAGQSPSTPAAAEGVYDREIEIEATGSGVEGATGLTARAGEKIEFKLKNAAPAPRALEIIDPSGAVVAEIEAQPSATAETIIPLATAGEWKLKVEGAGAPRWRRSSPSPNTPTSLGFGVGRGVGMKTATALIIASSKARLTTRGVSCGAPPESLLHGQQRDRVPDHDSSRILTKGLQRNNP